MGSALRAPGVVVGADLHLDRGFESVGSIDLFGAEVKGEIWLNGAHLNRGAAHWSLSAPELKVGGGVYCRAGFTAEGGVNLFRASIGSTLEFHGARLTGSDGLALRAPGLTVASNVVLSSGFTSVGGIDLSRAVIGGVLDIDGSRLSGSCVTLANAAITTMRGEPTASPDCWRVNHLAYTSLEPYRPAAQRLVWLRENRDGYHPQPYEQLARYYRDLGHDDQARTVLLAKQRHRRQGLSRIAQAWGYLQDAAVGYGYRPLRALAWLGVLVTVMTGYFWRYPPRATDPATAPRFEPVIYALDNLVPVLGLGQKSAYVATGAGQWIAWTGALAGWVLATTVVTAATRALARS